MRVLLTGASGFAGRAVLQQLLAHDHRVVAFDLDADGWAANAEDGPLDAVQNDERVRVVFGDVARYADVEAAAEGCDAIITAHANFGGSRAGQRPAGSDRGEKESLEVLDDPQPWLVMLKGLCPPPLRLTTPFTPKLTA